MQQQYTEEQGLLGQLSSGDKKLEGKTFYFDGVKKRSTALLLEAISLHGGKVESFLHKDVSFVVTESQEGQKEQKSSDVNGKSKGINEETQRRIKQQESVLSSDRKRPVTPRPVACGSRGKALLEKAIRNNERLQGSSVLANARSWGVKILYVSDVLLYLKQLTRESFSAKNNKPDKITKQGSVVKATALRSPYLKIEDSSRKYKPLLMQSMTFPSLCYSGRFSPFECPPPRFEKRTDQEENTTREKKEVESNDQNQCKTALSYNPSPWRPRKKDLSYCECCHQHFSNQDEHIQSDQHRAFACDPSNYSVVDQLVVDMIPAFDPNPTQQQEEILNRPPTPLPVQDFCELVPLSDVEMEHTVQALRREGSPYISSPSGAPLSFIPAIPSQGVQLPIQNSVPPPADIQAFPSAESKLPDIQPHNFSPIMPVLDVEPQPHNSACQQPDDLALYSETRCESFDSYPLPPVLSPHLPYSSYIMDAHSSYSDLPVLSPQQYTEEELVEEDTCKTDIAESLSESFTAVKVPTSTPLLTLAPVTITDGNKASNQEGPLVFNRIMCSSNKLPSCRSRSLPRQSAFALNPKKRCRSASPVNSRSKRRRITEEFGYSCRWTKQAYISAKPDSDYIQKPEGHLLLDNAAHQTIQSCPNTDVSSWSFGTSAVKALDSKQTFSTFSVPAVHNFTCAPHPVNILCHGSNSIANELSQPLFSTSKSLDPRLQFPSNKSHSRFSSQDSQCSHSHSTSVCIESALIPDLATRSSSDSDWDCNLLSHMGPTSARPLSPTVQSCELDKELLHQPCTWMHDTSYDSHLHNVLQPSTTTSSLCGEDMDPSAFSRTVVQIVEVQH